MSSQTTQKSPQSTTTHNSFVSDFEDELLTQKQNPKINVMTSELASALDRANVTSRNAMYIIAITLKNVGINLQDVNLSRSTIHRSRISLRKDIAVGLKEELKLDDNYVVHWDGKLLTDIIGSDTVDRLPIVLTSSGTEQLLGVPKIGSGTGLEQASAVYSTLNQWGVSPYIKALCFDTEPANTGMQQLPFNSYYFSYLLFLSNL